MLENNLISDIFYLGMNKPLTPLEKLLAIIESPEGKELPLTDQSILQLSSYLPGGKNIDLIACLEELKINATEHGKQKYTLWYTLKNKMLYCAVEDEGIGICNKLRPILIKSFTTADITCAAILRIALDIGVTSTGVVGRGQGLGFVSEFVRNVDGEMLISSSSGILLQHPAVNQGTEISTFESKTEKMGTFVMLSIPT